MAWRDDLWQVWTLGGLSPRALVKRVYREMNQDEIWGYAAQLAYYFLFSIFPFFIFLAALLAYVPIPDLLQKIMELLGQLVPTEALSVIQDNVVQLVTRERGGLLSFGIVLALWTASSAIAAMSSSLNRAYGVKESRPFWKTRGLAILLTAGLAVLMILSVILLIFGPELGDWLGERWGVGFVFDVIWNILRWPLTIFLMMFGAALIYYFAPDVEQEWRWITPGAVFFVITWILMSLGFGYYVENFGEYDKTYGSIGAVIVLLTWMYFSGFFLLLGGEINAEIEHAADSGKREGQKKLPKGKRHFPRGDIKVPS